MYFNKIHHPDNFVFATKATGDRRSLALAGSTTRFRIESLGGDVHRIRLRHKRWAPHGSEAKLASRIAGRDRFSVTVEGDGRLAVFESATRVPLLEGVSRATFGVSGTAWLCQFRHHADMQFYGLGEHNRGFEKSGQRVKFWNTDVFGDFASAEVKGGHPNPMYMSLPYVIVKRGNCYVGLLVNNPGAVFMDLASDFLWDGQNSADRQRQSFYVGAPDGAPELYVMVGPSLAQLTQKLQTLVGRTPRPPMWALGYHQCRWGYAGPDDLWALDRKFRQHRIPCDGLWLDIDYMERYRVFTFAQRHWGGPAKTKRHLTALAARGRRVVPILDPGVGVASGYRVYEDGAKRRIFCQTSEGKPFVGFVWPGKTHFPDFSLREGRLWWKRWVREFAAKGVSGAWLDMNDPSTGAVELEDMRFAYGTKPHATYHNQYALGMAQASHAGFLAAQPDRRPFLLTRSAFLSSSRYAAAWTGDNFSNWHHLQMVIPLSLGLALSGLPFNGPDVGGFLGDTSPQLAVAWHKVCFLFPFVRNHCMWDARRQEPWALGVAAQITITHFIRLRYKLLPYLYQLFVAQAESGAAILRPLFHDFEDTADLPLGKVGDQFLVGPDILQAPAVEEGSQQRRVVLPGPGRWFAAADGRWCAGGQAIDVRSRAASTPLYVREGAVVPMQAGDRTNNRNDFAAIELHVFLRRDSLGDHRLSYTFDDGESFAFRRGEVTTLHLACSVDTAGELVVDVRDYSEGFRALRVRVIAYDRFTAVRIIQVAKQQRMALKPHRWRFTGVALPVRRSNWVRLQPAC